LYVNSLSCFPGKLCWHYKRGSLPSDVSQGAYGPKLKLSAGRSDGNYSGDVDGFYGSLWFKAVNEVGDNSTISLTGGDAAAAERISFILRLHNYAGGATIEIFETGR